MPRPAPTLRARLLRVRNATREHQTEILDASAVFVDAALAGTAAAGHPTRPLATFDSAKKVARDAIYASHRTDFYCGCDFRPNHTKSGGTIDPKRCGYVPRKNKARGKVLEWEHVVPAYYFGHTRVSWSK